MTASETFRVDILGRYGVYLLALFAPEFWFAWPHYSLLLGPVVFAALLLGLLFSIGTVTVTSQGIVLFRIHKASWNSIRAVKCISFLGFPYLIVSRTKGFRLWIPLYLRRLEAFKAALSAKAPIGHPLREYAEGNI